jgi:hypothetical protein
MIKKQKKLIEEENEDETQDQAEIESDYVTEYEENPATDYSRLQSNIVYENENDVHMQRLNDKVGEVFKKSRWSILNPTKKIPKDLIPLIFQDILAELEGQEFTMVEKFVSICDYTALNYQKAYESIHMKYKELIVQEMDEKYGILSKKGIKKIF